MAMALAEQAESRQSGAHIETERVRGVVGFGERTGNRRSSTRTEADADRRTNGIRRQVARHRVRMHIEAGEG